MTWLAVPGNYLSTTTIATTRSVAIMAFGTGGSGIVDRMAIGAGCTSMVGTISIAASGMIEGCIPITGVVALCAVCTELPGMDRWFGVTGSAGCRKPAKASSSMTLRAVQVDMCASQREFRERMVKCCWQPAVG